MPNCAACGQKNPAEARFCLACGSPMPAGPAATDERKPVTAVFTDLVGSTATAEQLDPEDVRSRLLPYFTHVRRELERFGGTVEKFIGDAVVALFGAPVAHEDDPERGVRAALAVRETVAELNARDVWLDLDVRIGVSTGEALVVAQPAEGEGMAAGDVLNTAARLQASAPVNGILVGEQTYRSTARSIEYRSVEPVIAKGKSAPVLAWEAISARQPGKERISTGAPLVGREREARLLEELLAVVRQERRPLLALLIGAAGIGKSRLVVELEGHAGETVRVLHGRCLPYGEGITYWPIAEMVRSAAGILHSDPAELVSDKLASLLESLPTGSADELRTMAAALASLIGSATTPQGTYELTEIGQAELHWGIRRVVELLARAEPIVLVFEDLHWAEPTLLELVRFLALGSGPMLLLGTARPELADAHLDFMVACRALELSALADEDAKRLLSVLGSAGELPQKTLETVLQNAGGNPLFLEEMAHMLKQRDAVEAESLPVPDSLQTLIGSRLDQLTPEEKAVAQHASVVGSVFWMGALAHLAEVSSDGLPVHLARLEQRDLIHAHPSSSVAGEREYSFKHGLIRDVAYARLPKGRRAELHLRFSDWAKSLPSGEDDLVAIIAYHLEQACRLSREVARSPISPPIGEAVEFLGRAGESAERREGLREAKQFYARALELLDGTERETAAKLRVRLGTVTASLGDLGHAVEQLSALVEEAGDLGRDDLRSAALVELANVETRQGRASEARERALEAKHCAARIGDRRLEARALFQSGYVRAVFAGESRDGADELRRGIDLAEEMDDRALLIEGHMRLGTLLFNRGDLARADEQFVRCATLAAEVGSFRDQSRATSMLSFVRHYRGASDEAERLGLQALEWFEHTADSYFQLQNLRGLAVYALARGDPRLAEQRLQDALPLALDGGGWMVVEIYRYLVEALVAQGRIDDASRLAEFARRDVPEEDAYAVSALRVADGLVAGARGERDVAVRSFREALRLMGELDLVIDLCVTRIAFARVLGRLGLEEESRDQVERARKTATAMNAHGLAAEIGGELSRGATTAAS